METWGKKEKKRRKKILGNIKKQFLNFGLDRPTLWSPIERPVKWRYIFNVNPASWRAWVRSPLKATTGIPAEQVRKLTQAEVRGQGEKRSTSPGPWNGCARTTRRTLTWKHSFLDYRRYQAKTNRLNYVFEVQQGPTVAISTEGEKISKGQLKKLVPVYQENSVDDDLLNEGRRNLRDYLQTQGYFDANR